MADHSSRNRPSDELLVLDPRPDLVRGVTLLFLAIGLLSVGLMPAAADASAHQAARALTGLTHEGGIPGGPLRTLLEALVLSLTRLFGWGQEGPGPDRASALTAVLGPLALALLAGSLTAAATSLQIARRSSVLAASAVALALWPAAGWPSLSILTAGACALSMAQALHLRALAEQGLPARRRRRVLAGIFAALPLLLDPSLLPVSLLLLALVECCGARRAVAQENLASRQLLLLPFILVLVLQGLVPELWNGVLPGQGIWPLGVGPLGQRARGLLETALTRLPLLLLLPLAVPVLMRQAEILLLVLGGAAILLGIAAVGSPAEEAFLASALVLLAPPLAAGLEATLRKPLARLLARLLFLIGAVGAIGLVLVGESRLDLVRLELEAAAASSGEASPSSGALLSWRVLRREWAVPGAPLPLRELTGGLVEGEIPASSGGPHQHLSLAVLGSVDALLLPFLGLLLLLVLGLRDLLRGLDRGRPGP